jgi:tape measure domain-containing protein
MATEIKYRMTLDDLFTGKMKGAINQTQSLDKALNKITGTIGAVAGAFKLMDFGKSALNKLKEYEYFSAGLKTLMHGDADGAEVLQKKLVELAKTTPFSLEDVQRGTKNLLAYGFASNDVTKNLRMLGDVSAGVGAPLNDIIYLYGTLKASGRVTMKDLMQFGGRGIPIYEALSKTLHKSVAEIQNMTSQGKIGFKQIEDAFKSMTTEGGNFFNMMEEQSKTVGGQLSNLADSWDQLQIHLAQAKTGIIKIVVDKANAFVADADLQVQMQNNRDRIFGSAGVQQSNWLARQFNLGSTKAFEQEQTNVMSRVQLFAEHLEKGEITLANLHKAKLEEEAKNLQFRLAHAGLMERQTGVKVDMNELAGRAALVADGLKEIGKAISVYNKNKIGGKPEKPGGVGGEDLGTGITITGNRPQNLYINIDRLVEKLIVESQNVTEAAPKIKQLVAQHLIEAVNDINNMQR